MKIRSIISYIRAWWVWLKSHIETGKLPPGNLANLYTRELGDQKYLLKKFDFHGPILRTRMANHLTICVLGLGLCRKLLSDQKNHMIPVSFELKPLIPEGFMREMEGEKHTKYRSILFKAIHPESMAVHREYHRHIVNENLEIYASNRRSHPSAQDYIDILDTIGHSIMLHQFFGATDGTDYHNKLRSTFHRLWDKDWHHYLGKDQIRASEELKGILLTKLESINNPEEDALRESIIGRIHEAGALDETILVNLIYMVETGRLAVYSLMRWTTKYAVDHPEIFNRIANDPKVFSTEKDCIAQAFVQESLRLNQIERLLRHVTKSFIFEGFLFPKGSLARLCIWESHKSSDIFPDPFTFNPQRFLDHHFSLDEYAPFGIGSHRCPSGALSIQICRLYLHSLASHYKLEGVNNGPPFRGIAHYEPAKNFTVLLHPK